MIRVLRSLVVAGVAVAALAADAAGRQAAVTGTVIDALSGAPVPAVSVTLEPGDIRLETDDAGRFALPALALGDYVVRFSHAAYRVRVDTLRVARAGSMDARIAIEPTFVARSADEDAAGRTGRIVGRIRDRDTGRPLSDVRVAVEGVGSTGTTASGAFALQPVPAGRHRIVFEMLGYEAQAHDLSIESGQAVEVDVRLSTRPIELPALDVTVRSGWLERQGYYDRRDFGATGEFITRADIERRRPTELDDLLQDISGIKFHRVRGRNVIRFNRMVSFTENPLPGCEPRIWLDGRRYLDKVMLRPELGDHSHVEDINFVPPEAIEAIEVYTTNAPVEYHHACGAILIWTRRGGGGQGRG